MQKSAACYPLLKEMVSIGNPNSVTDAAVGALCIRAAVYGAFLNVKINASGLKDKAKADELVHQATEILNKSIQTEGEILDLTMSKM
jgi:glutamate formiminotransferase/formiminotetrahydrofolate cyclodeaminase